VDDYNISIRIYFPPGFAEQIFNFPISGFSNILKSKKNQADQRKYRDPD
jgi:hypothetical protein